MHLLSNALKKCVRRFSTASSHVLEQLNTRSLLRVSGNDAVNLLQGVITNDMQHLSHGTGSMYAMFLNNKGRVLYDTIIYRTPVENTYYLEVDTQVVDQLKKHLNMYRLRRKVDIVSICDEIKIWVHFTPHILPVTGSDRSEESVLEGKIVPCSVLDGTLPENNVISKVVDNEEILIFKDPRLSFLGSRILAPANYDDKVKEAFPGVLEKKYKWFRYRLGVGEGVQELPPGNCFPLEANCDYLHGVSFHKGCYIGQELTARTHHTGVVRKRLMPLIFEKPVEEPAGENDETIRVGEANVGKLRGIEQDTGLGLLRIAQALDAKLVVNNTVASTVKPKWWPQEVSKDRRSSSKL